MDIAVLGVGHLADTHRRAYKIKGFNVWDDPEQVELVFLCPDIMDHNELGEVDKLMDKTIKTPKQPLLNHADVTYVLVSQVPPGYTRPWSKYHDHLYYQVDTIIMRNAINRVVEPEQLIVGCKDDAAHNVPLAYQEYLRSFDKMKTGPALMDYETAEMAKCAINVALASQVELAQLLKAASDACGADYKGVRHVLHKDFRIGQHAYLHPGEINQHLKRDLDTVKKIIAKAKHLDDEAKERIRTIVAESGELRNKVEEVILDPDFDDPNHISKDQV